MNHLWSSSTFCSRSSPVMITDSIAWIAGSVIRMSSNDLKRHEISGLNATRLGIGIGVLGRQRAQNLVFVLHPETFAVYCVQLWRKDGTALNVKTGNASVLFDHSWYSPPAYGGGPFFAVPPRPLGKRGGTNVRFRPPPPSKRGGNPRCHPRFDGGGLKIWSIPPPWDSKTGQKTRGDC